MKSVTLATHTATVNGKQYDGIGNALRATLANICDEYRFVRHSIDGGIGSEVQLFEKDELIERKTLLVFGWISPLRYITEVLETVRYFAFSKKTNIFVGVDPLNALAGIILRKVGKADTVVFYTADYSPSRFGSKILDGIYHKIDSFCVRHADEVWSVSSKIVALRTKMGLAEDRNVFMPNVPPVAYADFRSNKHEKHTLIMASILDKHLDFEGAIRAVALLKDKYPKLKFEIIGNGPDEDNLKKLAKDLEVAERIHFLGRLSLSDTLEAVSRAGIGLALYTGVLNFNEFGDSTKCREYFAYGIPVISTNTHSTVGEIIQYDAGVVTDNKDPADYVDAIENILNEYNHYSKNALKLGIKYEGIHERELKRLIDA